MASESPAFLAQIVEVAISTVSFRERLQNMVQLLASSLNVDLVLYFAMERDKESLILNISSQGLIPSHMKIEFNKGQGLVGETATTRKVKVVNRHQPRVFEDNSPLEKLIPDYITLAAFPVFDDYFLYGVLLLMDNEVRDFTTTEIQGVQQVSLILASTVRQALLQEDAKKRIAELSVLFEVGKAFSSTVELDELLERVVSTTAKVTNARGAALQIVDRLTGEVRVSSQYGKIPSTQIVPGLLEELWGGQVPAEVPYLQGQTSDSEGRLQYHLIVPLTFKGHLQGSLCVFYKLTPNGEYKEFDPENRQLMFTMAGLIVNALENALTYQQVETLAERNERMVKNLTAAHEISRVMISAVQEDQLLNFLLQGLIHEMGLDFDRAQVLKVDETTKTLRGFKAAQRPLDAPAMRLTEALFLPLADEIQVSDLQIPLQPELGALPLAVLERRPYHIHQ
jgi:two-component system sensor histidine kinase HydH